MRGILLPPVQDREHSHWFLFWIVQACEDWATDSYRLVLKDGTQYIFNTEGKVTEIVDRTGNNRIRIEYAGKNLTRMVDTLGREVKFAYSGDKIVTITGGGKKVAYSYDGANLVSVTYTDTGEDQSLAPHPQDRTTRYGYAPVTVTYDGSSLPTRTFSFLNSYIFAFGQHLAKVAGTIGGGGEISYYHNDQLGSPMAMTDKTGRVIWSQDYLPYGLDLNENAQGGDTRFKFTGKEQDEATGLYYFNARWYDPDLGRFVTEDSYAGDPNDPQTLNLYAYVLANRVPSQGTRS